MAKIHQQKGEIIENVDGGEGFIEFETIEQHGPIFDEKDIAEVKIAMAMAHEAGTRTAVEPFALAREFVPGRLDQRGDRVALANLFG